MNLIRIMRGWLGVKRVRANRVTDKDVVGVRVKWTIRAYYAVLFYFALALLPEWSGFLARPMPIPLWPVAWLKLASLQFGIIAILTVYLVGSFLAMIWPQLRATRVLAFVSLFQFVAWNNSFGKIGHSLHLWVITSALLIFLPNQQASGRAGDHRLRQKYFAVFTGVQAVTLLIYTMSGLGKILGAIYQISQGETNIFMPKAFALITANRLLETNSQSLLGAFLINHPLIGWPLMWVDLYVQLFAFAVLFRPRLHRSWGVALILFHVGAYLFLTISFAQNCLLIALVLVNSPFAVRSHSWREWAAELPLFGRLFFKQCAS